jgi:hypothetical protein
MHDKINHIVPRSFVCAIPSSAGNPFLDWDIVICTSPLGPAPLSNSSLLDVKLSALLFQRTPRFCFLTGQTVSGCDWLM